jgi:nucleotide-binding universal stress UspA family protein
MKSEKVKKVLIALDYDPTAQKVAEEGYEIARSMKAEVTLLHVISDSVYYSSVEYSPIMGFSGFDQSGFFHYGDSLSLQKAAMLYLEKSREHLGNKKIKTIVKEGELSDVILDTAGKLKADLIVMGSHSRKWLENILVGSVTEKVIRDTSIPVFIVPTRKQE